MSAVKDRGAVLPPARADQRKDRRDGDAVPASVYDVLRGPGRALTPEWRALFERYPDRFLLGSDTWVPERWASYGDIMAGYRAWLQQLPPKVARQIAHGNARALFGDNR